MQAGKTGQERGFSWADARAQCAVKTEFLGYLLEPVLPPEGRAPKRVRHR